MTDKISRFLAERQPETPCLVMDLDVIAETYKRLTKLLPLAQVFYAVKANPADEIVAMLRKLGSSFDTASRGEIDLVLQHGAKPERISFGNTIKKERDIAYAYARGVRLFAFDSEAELKKLAAAAPGSRVFCRILMSCGGAEWPLSRKFGCSPEMAAQLLAQARDYGLDPYGLSFHVGSQQTDLTQWDHAVGQAAQMFRALQELNIDLRMINIGGGFPAQYRSAVAPLESYAGAVMQAISTHFGNKLPEIIIEPGRSLVGDAGVIQSEVVLISKKDAKDKRRWVYLDIGKFGGLAETMGESIKYALTTPRDGGATGPVILAGPTCDSADILYEKTSYRLPMDLQVGDKVEIQSTGAYTSSYCSVNFNGFPPLKTYCL
ncbi:MAG: type III PLP-dependent enzyme [Alphaproteobacteria bacterium]|nr:type III PLP-dependent enzyme [Alphaproteobacteria bacterium]